MGLSEWMTSNLVKFSFKFERFFPQFIRFYLNRKLSEYKQRDILADYDVKARRRGKYHYTFEVDLTLENKKGGEEYG
jgi:hypothetical protein